MKKRMILFLAVVASVISAMAMSPAQAFHKLANTKGFDEYSYGDTIALPAGQEITNCESVAIQNMVGSAKVRDFGHAIQNIIDKIPMDDVIVAAKSQDELGYVYATPNDDGTYDVLIVAAAGGPGFFKAVYGQADYDALRQIADSDILLNDNGLQIALNDNDNLIDI